MTLGRKGLAPGQEAKPQARGFGAATAVSSQSRATPRQQGGLNVYESSAEADEMRRKREAFLAQERSRNGAGDKLSAHQDIAYPGYAKRAGYGEKSIAMAYVCWFFLGQMSMHRFYIGAKESAIFQICLFFVGLASLFIHWAFGLSLLAAWCIWILADLFLIPGLIRKHSS